MNQQEVFFILSVFYVASVVMFILQDYNKKEYIRILQKGIDVNKAYIAALQNHNKSLKAYAESRAELAWRATGMFYILRKGVTDKSKQKLCRDLRLRLDRQKHIGDLRDVFTPEELESIDLDWLVETKGERASDA